MEGAHRRNNLFTKPVQLSIVHDYLIQMGYRSLNYAVPLARTGLRPLLIDADLRGSNMRKVAKREGSPIVLRGA